MYVCMCIYIYIYIYYKGWEFSCPLNFTGSLQESLTQGLLIYIYIYVYMYMYIYIYI